jgi:hypothetical protein
MTEQEWNELDALRTLGWVAATTAQRRRRRELLDQAEREGF